MTDSDPRDRLFTETKASGADFVFDETVAAVFPDMIERSVPGYPAIINMIQLLTERYAQPGSTLLDLGCSLGAATLALARGSSGRGCRVIGIDNAPAMLARAQSLLAADHPQIEWRLGDIREAAIQGASIVVLNFTLQFLPPADRLSLLQRIHAGLEVGGVLILSEKIAGPDPLADALLIEMHHAFKRANGYSELEISRKRSALENVLVPEPLQAHRQRLAEAGFVRADPWFQCFNFVSLVARR